MRIENDPASIRAKGEIAAGKRDVQHTLDFLSSAPLWRPSAALIRECREVLDLIDDQEKRFERKLLIAVIGPGGSGKSTLANALAGMDDLSPSSTRRPTTTGIVLVCRSTEDAAHLVPDFRPDDLSLVVEPQAFRTDRFILMDTPDIDSTQQKAHRPLVYQAIERADVLICLFNAENPKTRDHVDFFKPFVRRFHGESLIGVLNKCDRLDENELKEFILPDFEQYIAKAWERPLQALFCISAKRHLASPDWDDHAEPKHDFDQFSELEQAVAEVYSSSGATVQRRVKNTRQLKHFVQTEVSNALKGHKNHLLTAASRMRDVEKDALKEAFNIMKNRGAGQVAGVNVHLYQKMAQRWFGPVGWLIAIWARILIFGTGLMALLRFGNPVRQIMGIVSSLRHFKDSEASVASLESSEQLDIAIQTYRTTILTAWPEIADSLVKGGFDGSVRRSDTGLSNRLELNDALSVMWQDSLTASIEKAARRFSGGWLQLLLNLPTIGILGHTAWLTARHYFAADYLSTDFFVHALFTVGIVMFLSFFLIQGCLRIFYGPERIIAKAFEQIKMKLDPLQQMAIAPVFEQVERLLSHAESLPKD